MTFLLKFILIETDFINPVQVFNTRGVGCGVEQAPSISQLKFILPLLDQPIRELLE
jgi:hypothetical protein